MEAILAINLVVCGGLFGLFLADYAHRAKIRAEMQAAIDDFRKLTKAVQEAHNTLADTVKKTSDRLAALEMGAMKR